MSRKTISLWLWYICLRVLLLQTIIQQLFLLVFYLNLLAGLKCCFFVKDPYSMTFLYLQSLKDPEFHVRIKLLNEKLKDYCICIWCSPRKSEEHLLQLRLMFLSYLLISKNTYLCLILSSCMYIWRISFTWASHVPNNKERNINVSCICMFNVSHDHAKYRTSIFTCRTRVFLFMSKYEPKSVLSFKT